ncbi:MAG: serine hydrolase [Acidobacteria bacterium]|nr:serine hydrolase [Acidobacteriota bacterium]
MRKHSVVSSQQSVVGMGSRYRVLFILCALCVFCGESFSQALPVAAPQAVGMNAAKLNGIDALVEADIAAKKLPGAVVLVGHKGKIVFRKAYGNRSLVPTVEKMTVDTIFDLASLTKPIATATSIMILVEQGKLRLNDTIGMYIPDIDDAAAKRVTIQQLLTHTSGYRPDFDLGEKWTGREGMLAALKKEKLRAAPGTKFVYSDIGFIVLGEIFQRLGGSSVGDVAYLGIKGLQLQNTFFSLLDPGSSDPYRFTSFADSITPVHLTKKIAPSENIRGQNSYLGSRFDGGAAVGDKVLRGAVHDPTSYRMGGVAGHAGLFSTADDLARYCQMLLNGGTLDGKRVMSAKTISRMTAPIVVSESGDARGLGWDMNTSFSSNRGDLFPLGSFGHTGFTGTSVWIDRVSHTFVVFLSNRVHPDGKGDVGPLRAKVATVVASAIEDTPIEKFKQAEAEFNAAVAAQVPRFREVVAAANRVAAPTSAASSVAAGAAAFPAKSVLNGIDVLERNGFKEFEGMKIGLVTNHTGRNLAGKQTIDILNEAKNVKLTAMFAPEHGIRGELDTEKIDDTKDEKTGLPVYSLYKDGMRRPKPEQTATIDAFVYDIQDIGARFYTYTATLKNVMEEAAKAGNQSSSSTAQTRSTATPSKARSLTKTN